jgi:hypothetical protein
MPWRLSGFSLRSELFRQARAGRKKKDKEESGKIPGGDITSSDFLPFLTSLPVTSPCYAGLRAGRGQRAMLRIVCRQDAGAPSRWRVFVGAFVFLGISVFFTPRVA